MCLHADTLLQPTSAIEEEEIVHIQTEFVLALKKKKKHLSVIPHQACRPRAINSTWYLNKCRLMLD